MSLFEIADFGAAGLVLIGAVVGAAVAFYGDGSIATRFACFAEQLVAEPPMSEEGAKPFSRYIQKSLGKALRFYHQLVKQIGDERYQGGLLIADAAISTAALALLVAHFVELVTDFPEDAAIMGAAISPILFGTGVWFCGSSGLVDKINGYSARSAPYHEHVKSLQTKFARFGLRPAAWGFRKIHEASEPVPDTALRAGIRMAAWFYWAGIVAAVAVAAIVAAIEIVLIIAVVLIALLIISKALGGSPTLSPGSGQRITRRERDFWGNEKEVIYQGGRKVGELRTESRGGILGLGAEQVKVEYDRAGKEATIRQEKRGGILGLGAEDVQVRYDSDGKEVSHSRIEERGGILGMGAEHVRVEYDKDGNEISQTKWEDRGGVLGIGADRVKVTRDNDAKK